MKDIASALGVSPGTISNAFNQPHQLSAALRGRILATAEEMGYTPNPAARNLRLGKSGLVGFVYPDALSYAFSDPAAILFLRGLALVTEEAGLSLVLVPGFPHDARNVSAVNNTPVDGFVIYSMAEGDPLAEAAEGRDLPTVYVDRDTEGSSAVIVDDAGGAAAVAKHLLALGHRRFGVISMELTADVRSGMATPAQQAAVTYRPTRERLGGYRGALEAAGVAWQHVPVYECSTNSIAEGKLAAEALLGSKSRPTALLAMSDQVALGALETAQNLGLRVPEDVSIVGFDDIPEAALAQPPLTTVRQPLEEKGRAAGRLLVAQLRGETLRKQLFPVKVLIRNTTTSPSS